MDTRFLTIIRGGRVPSGQLSFSFCLETTEGAFKLCGFTGENSIN
jgi:hypothetical protein